MSVNSTCDVLHVAEFVNVGKEVQQQLFKNWADNSLCLLEELTFHQPAFADTKEKSCFFARILSYYNWHLSVQAAAVIQPLFSNLPMSH